MTQVQVQGRAGFSLVEVLVALALFAMIGAAGAAVLSISADNRERVLEASQRLARLQRLDALLRADLGQAVARQVRDTAGQPRAAAFVGGPAPESPGALFDFVRQGWENPGEAPRPSIQRLEYRLVDGRLERRTWPHPDGARPDAPIVLHDGVRQARAVFIQGGRESDGWAGTEAQPLPEAVRLELELDDLGPVALTVLVAAP